MAIHNIPLQATPNQRLSVDLGGQNTTFSLATRLGKLYASVAVGNTAIIHSRVCLNNEPIVREAYRGFIGELYFIDLRGGNDPEWAELGSRYLLRWETV